MQASTNLRPTPPERQAERSRLLPVWVVFLLAALVTILLAAGCAGAPGTQQALEEQQQQNEELQQKVDELEKEQQAQRQNEQPQVVIASGAAVVLGVIEAGGMWQTIASIPEFLWELSLGIWLIVKGFNPSVIASEKFRLGSDDHSPEIQGVEPVPTH